VEKRSESFLVLAGMDDRSLAVCCFLIRGSGDL